MVTMSEFCHRIGEAFKEERILQNLTQEQMAQIIDCCKAEYKAIEAGRAKMNFLLFFKICRAFENQTSIKEMFENVGISFNKDRVVDEHGNKLTYYGDFFENDDFFGETTTRRPKTKE